jgi:hypothetical protein
MFTDIARRLAIGLGMALVVGSLALATAGPAKAQAKSGQTGTAPQTIVPATYGPMGGFGSGHGMMTDASYGQSGPMGHWSGQASARYHGGSRGGHGGGCW